MCRQHRPGRKHSSLQQAGNCLDSVCVCVCLREGLARSSGFSESSGQTNRRLHDVYCPRVP